ncbi:MAG: hypothetical protein QNJ55_30615 [Xenococcus sp. MO_188.B8]|nr:hypothetical protein [Xenococcus sp. MO_188.B8]
MILPLLVGLNLMHPLQFVALNKQVLVLTVAIANRSYLRSQFQNSPISKTERPFLSTNPHREADLFEIA